MTSDYTPSTEDIWNAYWGLVDPEYRNQEAELKALDESRKEFHRWLRQVKSEAWREGYDSGFGDGSINAWDPENPYQ